ncbi:hypothetical protein Ac2012v2_005091 [Leucoagaricus gongylophorus]
MVKIFSTFILMGLVPFSSAHPISNHIRSRKEGSVASHRSTLGGKSLGIAANTGVATANDTPALIPSVSEGGINATTERNDNGNTILTSCLFGSGVNNFSSSSSSFFFDDCNDDNGTIVSPSASTIGGPTSMLPSTTATPTNDFVRVANPTILDPTTISTPTNSILGDPSQDGNEARNGVESKGRGRNDVGKRGLKSKLSHGATIPAPSPAPSTLLGSSCSSSISSDSGSDMSASGDSGTSGAPVSSVECVDSVTGTEPSETNNPEPSSTSIGAPGDKNPSSAAGAVSSGSIQSSTSPEATESDTVAILTTSQAGNSADSSTTTVSRSGKATWFTPGLGSCGESDSDSDFIVALATNSMSNGENCNKSINITDPKTGKTATAKVYDTCLSCASSDLNMSPSLFQKFEPLDVGTFDVEWNFE